MAGQRPAQLGASYYPGQDDDFYMPVVSPMPQRNKPQMPDQIAQNIANLELGAHTPSIGSDSPGVSPMGGSANQFPPAPRQDTLSNLRPAQEGSRARTPAPVPEEEPSFSVFPVIRNRKPSVPPSDEEKENILETAREAVLNSNDPEMQLAWAQDALVWVEIAQQNEQRLSQFRTPRSSTPRIERQLRVDAINVVDFLAKQGHPKAEFLRGTWLEFGRFGFQQDKREAFRCYGRSAAGGYARSYYRMGMQFEGSNEIDKAIRQYENGVSAGDAAASYRMGMMSLLGQNGQRQDFGKALELIHHSAETADENAPQGAYVLGMLYARELHQVQLPDHTLQQDPEAARVNIEKAAYLGFAKAQVKMGTAYELSELNCAFDPVLSLHYNNLAARQGEAEAEMAISKWFLSGYEGTFAKNEAMAFAYAQRAASTGLPTAEFAMGYFYEVGIHVQTSLKEARIWYGKAADHGNKDAAGRIDGISRSKTLSRKDHEKIAMARLKSVRGNVNGNRRDQTSTPTVSMPQVPEFGQSYAQAPTQTGQQPGYPATGHPYGPQSQQLPQPGAPNYSNMGPTQGQGFYIAPADRPYPVGPGNGPGPGPGPGPGYGYGGPGQRPPNQPPYPGGPQAGYAANFPSAQGPRPGPSGYGQGPPYGPGQGGPQSRVPSGPQAGRPGPQPSASPLPDIGFTAPPDMSGADRRRLPGGRLAQPAAGRGGAPSGPSSGPPSGPTGRPPSGPSGGPAPPLRQGTNQPPQGRPGPGQPSTPSNAHLPRVPVPSKAQPAAPAAVPTPPVNLGPSKPPVSAAAPQRRPGKGPATFEEMGVPATKKQEDCLIM